MADIIITNLSKLGLNRDKKSYSYGEYSFEGVNTNEAPVKCLIKCIDGNKKNVDKIIAVTTTEALPAYEKFTETVKEFAEKEGIAVPEPKMIKEKGFAETVKQVAGEFSKGDCAYIDTTGGFRNASYFLMCVVRILEYTGVSLKKAVYSNNEKMRIEDVKNIYDMYDLINAVDSFTKFGNSHGLEQYFAYTEESAVKEVISAMNDFSDMLSLCRTSGLSGVLEKLNSSLEKLSNTDTDSAGTILFKSLIPSIREKFYMKRSGIEYPDIVRWCLDNRLIQQAVTIYVERMPEYFYKKGYFTVRKDTEDKIRKETANSAFDFSYNLFYNSFLAVESNKESDNALRRFLSEVLAECPVDFEYNKDNKAHVTFGKLLRGKNAEKILDEISDVLYKAELEKPLNELIKLRKALYLPDGKLDRAGYAGKLSYSPELKEHILGKSNLLAKTSEKFMRSAVNDLTLIAILSGQKCEKKKSYKYDVIEAMTEGKMNEGFAVGENMNLEKMQEVLRDIIYAKNFIRNRLNHAGDEGSVDKSMQVYFSSHGYNVNDELSVEDIRIFIRKAMNNLTI